MMPSPARECGRIRFFASIAIGLLLKGLIAAVFPIAAAGLYLLFTKQLRMIVAFAAD